MESAKEILDRLPYEAPRLLIYGGIEELTAAKPVGGMSDGQNNQKT